MATGACGINCDVCRLNLLGTCSTCGPGKSSQAAAKCEVQQRLFGQPCPVLACAVMNRTDYCMRDCDQFPCDNFSCGYPFSSSFLQMQQRRLAQLPPACDPNGRLLEVPAHYWEVLQKRSSQQVCNATLAETDGAGSLRLSFLNRRIRVAVRKQVVEGRFDGKWQLLNDPLLELIVLAYLTGAERIYPLSRQLVGIKDLKQGFYFQGRHSLPLEPLLARFRDDPDGFAAACLRLAGCRLEMADLAFRLPAFERLPVYFLFWRAGRRFDARIDVLFAPSVEHYLAVPIIWLLVRRLVVALIQGRV